VKASYISSREAITSCSRTLTVKVLMKSAAFIYDVLSGCHVYLKGHQAGIHWYFTVVSHK